jgi:hypothetical protein
VNRQDLRFVAIRSVDVPAVVWLHLSAGMVFNVCIGVTDVTFSDCSTPSTKYSMLVADTVRCVELLRDSLRPHASLCLCYRWRLWMESK